VTARLIRRRTSSASCVVHFGEYCKALRIAIDTHGDHTAFSHTVHSFGGSLDIVWVQVPASEHDEILGAAADVESPMLVEISQVPGVEPTVIAREWHDAAGGQITVGDRGSTNLNSADLPGGQRLSIAGDEHLHAG